MFALASAMVGFCSLEVNPFGPVQLYVAFAVEEDPVSCRVSPAHGVLAAAVASTVLPVVITVTAVVLEQPLAFCTVMVYCPASSPLKTFAVWKSVPLME